jgi:GntR family transcriptional regulator, galactonate operon transcriptional repressor
MSNERPAPITPDVLMDGHRITRPGGLVPTAVKVLVARVVTGEFDDDTDFPTEAALTTQLGVSRTVVREALRVLENKGLIAIQQGRPTRARSAEHWNLLDPIIIDALVTNDPTLGGIAEELIQMRAALEADMTRTVTATGMDDTTRAHFDAAWTALDTHLDDVTTYFDLDRRFHDVIMVAAGNRFARHTVRQVFAWTARWHPGDASPDDIHRAHTDHTHIRELVLAGDHNAAAEAMHTHILRSWHTMRERVLAQYDALASR